MGKPLPLPDDSLFDILLLVPVKSMRRFECVSKSCFSIIHSRLFINRHLIIKTTTNSGAAAATLITLFSHRWTIPRSAPPDATLFICFSDTDAPDNLRKLECCQTDTQVLSCNGLLCFSLCSNRYIVISNLASIPIDYHLVPIPPLKKKLPKGMRPPFFGFGFDSFNHDYKVLVMNERRTATISYAETRVYSLRSNSWSRNKRWDGIDLGRRTMFPSVVKNHLYPNIDSSPNGIVASGAFHWLAQEILYNIVPKFILAFSLASEEFYDIPLPSFPQRRGGILIAGVELGVHKGRLCISVFDVIETPYLRFIDIWVMEDYYNNASWTKIIHMEKDTCYGIPSCPIPTYSRSEYEILFLVEYTQRFYWYDLRNRKLVKCVGDYSLQPADLNREEIGFRTATICLETLVSLNDYKVLWERDSKRKRKRSAALKGTKRRIKDEEQAKQALECFFKIRDKFHHFWSK